jgi:hypothetical protein
MDPDRWRRVNDLFHAALDRDPGERAVFLAEACGDDVAVHAEVTRLRRPVAIKALSPRYLEDEHRRRRLRREAQAAATLSHPGIATVYALEEFDGALYLVCEYVPGATLREALTDGPLPAATLLRAGVEMASALAAAHDRDGRRDPGSLAGHRTGDHAGGVPRRRHTGRPCRMTMRSILDTVRLRLREMEPMPHVPYRPRGSDEDTAGRGVCGRGQTANWRAHGG